VGAIRTNVPVFYMSRKLGNNHAYPQAPRKTSTTCDTRNQVLVIIALHQTSPSLTF